MDAVPSVAWRTIAMPDGRLLMTHQRRLGAILKVVSGGYGGQCGGPVESALTVVGTDGAPFAVAPLVQGALPPQIEQPVLAPGQAFEYTSGCPLTTPSGIMVGTYEMVDANGKHFLIDIPAFSLDYPEEPRHVN